MTRYVIDPTTTIRLLRERIEVPDTHRLVAPGALRSQVMSILFREVRDGVTTDAQARALLDSLTTPTVRLLNDRVSRAIAWKVATELGWDDTVDAEYVAVTRLQADALVAGGTACSATPRVVPLAPFEDLARG